jgi:hypothetical protein
MILKDFRQNIIVLSLTAELMLCTVGMQPQFVQLSWAQCYTSKLVDCFYLFIIPFRHAAGVKIKSLAQ